MKPIKERQAGAVVDSDTQLNKPRQAAILPNPMLPAAFHTGSLLYWQSSEDGLLPSKLDWQDFQRMSENPEGFWNGHSLIPINDNTLSCIPYISFENNGYYGLYHIHVGEWGLYQLVNDSDGFHVASCNHSIVRSIKWFHELQLHFYATTGKELEVNLDMLECVANEKEIVKTFSDPTDTLPF